MTDFLGIDTILFDMDGTLTDLGKRWWDPFFRAFNQLKPDYDHSQRDEEFENSVVDVIKAASGHSRFLSLRIVWKVTRAMRLNLIESYKLLKYMRADPLAFKEIVPLENAELVVQELQNRGYRLALVTTASQETVDTAIQEHEFFQHFQTVVSRSDVKRTKPHPESLLIACERLHSNPEQTVMIGDFPQDVQAGKAAGCKTIGILGLNGKYTAELLEAEKPDIIIEELSELLALLPHIP